MTELPSGRQHVIVHNDDRAAVVAHRDASAALGTGLMQVEGRAGNPLLMPLE